MTARPALPILLDGTKDEIVALVNSLPHERYRVVVVGEGSPALPASAEDQDALAKRFARTPEEIAATRAEILSRTHPRELPPGKTLWDVVCGTWPGTETDEQIREVLERLS